MAEKPRVRPSGKPSSRESSMEEKMNKAEAERRNKAEWAKKTAKLRCRDISIEFNEAMKKYVAPDVSYKVCEKNEHKNRYCDVKCVDQTRVVLKGRGEEDDYIHASWIKVPYGIVYICTQGPMTETIEDFWWMVKQEKCSIILMLCDFYEQSKIEKCAVYFPLKPKEKMTFGHFTVRNLEVLDDLNYEGIQVSILAVSHRGITHTLKHVFMKSWPDNLAPIESEPVIALWKWTKKNADGRPVVVHCSAGVGRTSTFVGFELANHMIGERADVSLMDVVKKLRAQRYQSIQSHIQFLYLHVLLIEYFQMEKIIPKNGPEKKFVDEYRRHAKKKLDKREVKDLTTKKSMTRD